MKFVWRIAARYYTKRSSRSLRRSRVFRDKAEKFFRRVKGRVQ